MFIYAPCKFSWDKTYSLCAAKTSAMWWDQCVNISPKKKPKQGKPSTAILKVKGAFSFFPFLVIDNRNPHLSSNWMRFQESLLQNILLSQK